MLLSGLLEYSDLDGYALTVGAEVYNVVGNVELDRLQMREARLPSRVTCRARPDLTPNRWRIGWLSFW